MVKRQHRVRLAAAEVGLQLHHRVASRTCQTPRGSFQQTSQAFGEIRAAEELLWISILVRTLSKMNLP